MNDCNTHETETPALIIIPFYSGGRSLAPEGLSRSAEKVAATDGALQS